MFSEKEQAAALLRITAEKERCVQEFMKRYRLLCQHEDALTIPQQQPEPPKRLVWPKGSGKIRRV